MKKSAQERITYLKHGIFGEDILVKVQRGSTLILKLDPSLHGIKVKLFTNYSKDNFQRTIFNQLDFSDNRFDEDTKTILKVDRPGSFSYYFTTENDTVPCGGGWILVDPDLKVNNEDLSLESICIVTYMPKCLGPFKEWEGRLTVAKETGFNFIHFTPVQALGPSGSGYSLLNQLELDPRYGHITWEDMKSFITKLRNEWGVLSLCDIVLNHTANESPWLQDHPDSAYNLQNSPHLIPAYLLDCLLLKLSNEVARDEWQNRGVPATLNCEDHLNNLRSLLHDQIRELRLEEFYFISVVDCRLDAGPNEGKVKIIHTYQRFGSKVGGNTPRWEVEKLNEETRNLIRNHLNAAVENVIAGIRYERIQSTGPKYEKVTKDRPLTHRYFTEINGFPADEERNEVTFEIEEVKRPFIMAHNGWVMNDDPLRNFANADSNVYLRRELIPWSDSVKLRYGSGPQASPFLWSYMRQYVELVASVFDGIRLDNCHSTPLHVAEYLIDSAREIRPELLVVAELFTNCDGKDNVFVNHLGINVLIREAQQAWNSHEQGRLLFRYGGKPVGAFENTVPPPIADALFFDQTHDNPSPMEKRCIRDILPTAALVSFGAFAIGTNRGYDDVIPYHIHVVNESRLYASYAPRPELGEVNLDFGMFRCRKTLNRIHQLLGQDGFSETFIDQLDEDVVSITRGNPKTRESMILVAYTAFHEPSENFNRPPHSVRALEIQGQVTKIIFEGRIIPKSVAYTQNSEFLNGIQCHQEWRENLPIEGSKFIDILKGIRISRVEFSNFQPGDVVAFRVQPFPATTKSLVTLAELLTSPDLELLIGQLDLVTLNYVLYRCKEEGGDLYTIPNYGELVYAGLQGIATILDSVSLNNDLGHPICCNLRDGQWLMDYIVNRLMVRPESLALGAYVQKLFSAIEQLPNYLVPTYFEQCFTRIYKLCIDSALKRTNSSEKTELWKLLSLSSLQFVGIADGGALPAGGDEVSFQKDGKPFISYSLCAGLPHFSTGYMRNWGRDTFIALPGLLLLTGRSEEARQHILSYASVLRHGLIPNLLNEGNCRYNCRDATWWWLYAIVRYIDLVPNGHQILKNKVTLDGKLFQLHDVIHSSIDAHFKGIKFREENAGPQIDAHMKDEGFNIQISTDKETGFIHGGNAFNCGTWMDKMGSSEVGGNRGIPATPRDGAAVEIVGLSAAVLNKLSKMEQYTHKHVGIGSVRLTYADWYRKIKSSFESYFFISPASREPLANVRNIYKDTLGASNSFGDFQLRPNFLIAMVVAPELFSKANAILALEIVHEKLVSKLGLKTLDESDWNYNGDYFNLDSSDTKTAGGFNYHQGPEWLWPMGFYLRACLHFQGSSAISVTRQTLSRHYEHLRTSPWKSLPELTNRDGEICNASCPAQAWSCGTLLEVLHDLEKQEA